MVVPGVRLLFAPSRSTRLTVPCVVGFHVIVMGWPAVAVNPSFGMLNGLDWVTARSGRTRARKRREKCMLIAMWSIDRVVGLLFDQFDKGLTRFQGISWKDNAEGPPYSRASSCKTQEFKVATSRLLSKNKKK